MLSVEEQRPGGPLKLPWLPDDLSLTQFSLDVHHSVRAPRASEVPWFIDDETGKSLGLEQVRCFAVLMCVGIDFVARPLDSYANLGSCHFSSGEV